MRNAAICALAFVGLGAGSPAAAQTAALRSAQAMLSESGIQWVSVTSARFRLHVERGSPAELAVDLLARQAEAARKHVLGLLGQGDAPVLDLFYVASRDRMESLTGARPKALAVPSARYALFVYNGQVSAHHRHELMHVLAGHFWGAAARPAHWINEGLAQHAEGGCGGYALDELAAALPTVDRWIEPAQLVQAFGAQPTLDATVLSGSLVGYLFGEYGRERVAGLWRHGLGRFEKLYGRSFTEVAEEWRRSLPDGGEAADGIDWARLAELGCG